MCLGGSRTAIALTGDPALFQRSYDEEAAGHTEEALAALDKLSPAKSGAYLTQLRRGWLLYRLGRHAEAIEAYEKASSLDAKSVEARLGILLPLMAAHNWQAAEKAARDVLRSDASNYLATLRLAFVQYSQGRYGESRTLYKKLAEGYPSDVEVRAGLGWALLKLGRNDEAASAFREVLEIAPKNVLALQGLSATGLR
jgi:tetratricopeptide (TPR) repeat protein